MHTLAHLAPLSISRAIQRIPASQLAKFNEETDEARQWVLDWIAVLDPLQHIKGRVALFPEVAARMGDKPGNVKRRYYAWIEGVQGKCEPIWENLIDRARFPKPGDHALDERFLEHWRSLREQQRRLNDGGRQAHRDLMSQLAVWEANPYDPALAIPGYTTPPERDSYCSAGRLRVPSGWSYRNLSRYNPRRIELVNIIVGPKAASTLLPSNLGTRAGMAYRQTIISDDQEYDNEIVSPFTRGVMLRPQGFNIIDYFTGAWETYGIQFRRIDDEGKKRGINQEAYVWTVLIDLNRNGFRDDELGTTIIREHATAKGYVKKDGYGDSFDELLNHITGGCVTFDASGRFDQPAFAQLFLGSGSKQASGNFRYKGPIESAFRGVRTRSASLLGDTSQNARALGPESNEAIGRYEKQLWTAIEKLPPSDRHFVFEMLRHPVHTQHEYSVLCSLIYRALDARRDHSLEGWAESGFVLPALHYEVPNMEPGLVTRDQFAAMSEPQQQMLQTFGKWRPLHLSPGEARQLCRKRDRAILRKLEWSRAVAALPMTWAYPLRKGKEATALKVRPDGTILIRDPERFGPSGLEYLGVLHTAEGRIHLRPGESVMLHVPPFSPDEALLLDPQGRYRGTVKLNPRTCGADREARLRAQGAINEYAADMRRGGERRAEAARERQRADIDHNARVFSGEIQPDPDALAAARYQYDLDAVDAAAEEGVIIPEPESPWSDDYLDATPTVEIDPETHHFPQTRTLQTPCHIDPFANIYANHPDLDGE